MTNPPEEIVFDQPRPEVEAGRIHSGPMGSDEDYGNNGLFLLRSPYRSTLQCIVSNDMGWEHVSVTDHRRKRIPTWDEMCWIKDQFWPQDECVVQYHPPRSEYVNLHPYVLHLWRPLGVEFPAPPSILVGPTNDEFTGGNNVRTK